MIKALEFGLDYDQANFSPYQFYQVRILEFPDYSEFAESFANTIPYSEGIGFIIDTDRHLQDRHDHLRHRPRARSPVVGAIRSPRPTCRARPC